MPSSVFVCSSSITEFGWDCSFRWHAKCVYEVCSAVYDYISTFTLPPPPRFGEVVKLAVSLWASHELLSFSKRLFLGKEVLNLGLVMVVVCFWMTVLQRQLLCLWPFCPDCIPLDDLCPWLGWLIEWMWTSLAPYGRSSRLLWLMVHEWGLALAWYQVSKEKLVVVCGVIVKYFRWQGGSWPGQSVSSWQPNLDYLGNMLALLYVCMYSILRFMCCQVNQLMDDIDVNVFRGVVNGIESQILAS